jgi:hypothetical protein
MPNERTVHALVNDWKLSRIGSQTFDHGINLGAESRPQAGNFVLVPVLRLDQFGSGGRREDHRTH